MSGARLNNGKRVLRFPRPHRKLLEFREETVVKSRNCGSNFVTHWEREGVAFNDEEEAQPEINQTLADSLCKESGALQARKEDDADEMSDM